MSGKNQGVNSKKLRAIVSLFNDLVAGEQDQAFRARMKYAKLQVVTNLFKAGERDADSLEDTTTTTTLTTAPSSKKQQLDDYRTQLSLLFDDITAFSSFYERTKNLSSIQEEELQRLFEIFIKQLQNGISDFHGRIKGYIAWIKLIYVDPNASLVWQAVDKEVKSCLALPCGRLFAINEFINQALTICNGPDRHSMNNEAQVLVSDIDSTHESSKKWLWAGAAGLSLVPMIGGGLIGLAKGITILGLSVSGPVGWMILGAGLISFVGFSYQFSQVYLADILDQESLADQEEDLEKTLKEFRSALDHFKMSMDAHVVDVLKDLKDDSTLTAAVLSGSEFLTPATLASSSSPAASSSSEPVNTQLIDQLKEALAERQKKLESLSSSAYASSSSSGLSSSAISISLLTRGAGLGNTVNMTDTTTTMTTTPTTEAAARVPTTIATASTIGSGFSWASMVSHGQSSSDSSNHQHHHHHHRHHHHQHHHHHQQGKPRTKR